MKMEVKQFEEAEIIYGIRFPLEIQACSIKELDAFVFSRIPSTPYLCDLLVLTTHLLLALAVWSFEGCKQLPITLKI